MVQAVTRLDEPQAQLEHAGRRVLQEALQATLKKIKTVAARLHANRGKR